jgi:uncharacterized secreted protein with C-terminal beta-propeller domain
MSVVKRGVRAGVAAFALGVSLSGPQAAGIAAADPAENDSSSASASQPSQSHDGRPRGRASRSARNADSAVDGPRRGRVSPQQAATAETTDATVAETAPLQPSRGDAGPGGRTGLPHDSDPSATQPPGTPAPASATIAEVPSNAAAAAATPGANVQSVAPVRADAAPASAVGTGPITLPVLPVLPAAAAATAANAVTTPAPAPAVAALGAAITGFFDSTANWLATLPAGPLTEAFEGALLLVRRSIFNAFPALNVGQTTGQAGDTKVNAAYFTREDLSAYLLELAKQQYGGLFGQTVPVYGNMPYPIYDYKAESTAKVNSDTNTQVNGVDEADLVENDGKYIYTAHNGRLTITGADLSVASESTLNGNVVGEFLSGDRLTVITQSGSGWYGPYVKMAYCGPWGQWKPQTTVTVYDVADRTAPAVVKQTVFDGGYESSRAVDGVVYVVLQRSVNLPAPNYTDTPIEYIDPPVEYIDTPEGQLAVAKPIRFDPGAPTANRTYETWDEYVARVGDQIVDLSLPHAYTVDADGNTVDIGLVADAESIVRPHTADQRALLTVASLDSGSAPGGPAFDGSVASMVATNGGTVYMTPDALYVATSEGQYTESHNSTGTRIERFTVAGTDVGWQASGVVAGTLINQFAMDEQGGYLRVATHTTSSQLTDGTWITQDDNGIHVLDTAGGTLDEVGRLSGLAPGEQLYAVRYVGDTAYLVTFVRTDPLFAIDLSDPTAPTLLGELVVPGFSNYLQPVGDGLLLGIGQEREAGTWNSYVHATLFDTHDPTNLTQIEREFLDPGSQWSWSAAQFDHHAVLYSPEDGLLVVPVSGSGYDEQTGYHSDQFLSVLRVGPGGIDVIGEIHTTEPVLRTVRIGDVIYAVGDNGVTAYRLSDLSEIGSTAAAPAVV